MQVGSIGLVAYVFFCLFGILFFVMGLALFCAGLTSPRSALSQLSYSLIMSCLVMLQYYFIGYSLENSRGDNYTVSWSSFVGDLSHMFFRNLDLDDPFLMAHVLLRYTFAVVPACLLASAACQRGKFLALMVFVSVWMTIVYCPVAYWCWHQNGWSFKLGALDYAGGSIIHISSGFGALVYSLVLGPRVSYLSPVDMDPPFSLPLVIVGTMMMWMGWIGFTGGAQYGDISQSLLSVLNTMLSASMGGFSWMLMDNVVNNVSGMDNRLSLVSFCSGVVSGLVTITSGAGYVHPHAAVFYGLLGGLGCNLSTKLKFYIGVDDPLDVFAVHGMGGMIGTLLTGLFALEKYSVKHQFWVQFLSAFSVAAYTLGCTLVISVTVDSVIGIRVPVNEELMGTDVLEHGEVVTSQQPTVQNWLPPSEHPLDRSTLTQLNSNASMYPTSFDPLLQRLPLSYGNYTTTDR